MQLSLRHPSGEMFFDGWMRKRERWCILGAPVRARDLPGARSVFAPRAPVLSMSSPSDILIENLPLVERIIQSVCRGRGMDATQTEEFSGFVKLRLVENDYAIIRAFKQRSSFGTYLTTVVARLLNDHRNHEWGKWHDSAEAKRLGSLAIDLERLIVRDMRSLDDALATLVTKYPGLKRATLEEIASRFPKRYRRKWLSLDDTPEPLATTVPSDDVANAELAERISRVVNAFVQNLSKQDQTLFQLRFGCDMPVPQIATTIHDDAQVLYRRLRTHMGALRAVLEVAGVSAADVAALIGSDGALLDFKLKSDGGRPSKGEDPATPEEDE